MIYASKALKQVRAFILSLCSFNIYSHYTNYNDMNLPPESTENLLKAYFSAPQLDLLDNFCLHKNEMGCLLFPLL